MVRKRTTAFSIGSSYYTRTVSRRNHKQQMSETPELHSNILLHAYTKYNAHQKPRSPDYENRSTGPNKLPKPQFPHRPPTYLDGRALSTSLNSSGTSRGLTQILLTSGFDFRKRSSKLLNICKCPWERCNTP